MPQYLPQSAALNFTAAQPNVFNGLAVPQSCRSKLILIPFNQINP